MIWMIKCIGLTKPQNFVVFSFWCCVKESHPYDDKTWLFSKCVMHLNKFIEFLILHNIFRLHMEGCYNYFMEDAKHFLMSIVWMLVWHLARFCVGFD